VSTDREKLDQLLQRLEEITVTLNQISEELRSVSSSLKSLAVGQITRPPTVHLTVPTPKSEKPTLSPTITSPPPVTSKQRSLDDIRMAFPEELEARLDFEERGDYIIIKPKQFLGSENFAKIASAVRGMGGEYISAGKESHFRVPKKKA